MLTEQDSEVSETLATETETLPIHKRLDAPTQRVNKMEYLLLGKVFLRTASKNSLCYYDAEKNAGEKSP